MDNPWNIYGPAMIIGFLCYVCFWLNWNPIVALLVAFIVLVVLFILFHVWIPRAYENWLSKKINSSTYAFQKNHDVDTYFKNLDNWEKYARTQHSKNVFLMNRVSALYETNRIDECLQLLDDNDTDGQNFEVKTYLLKSKILCYEKLEDEQSIERCKEELGQLTKLKTKTPKDYKKSMLLWFSVTILFIVLFLAGIIREWYDGIIVTLLFFIPINFLVSIVFSFFG